MTDFKIMFQRFLDKKDIHYMNIADDHFAAFFLNNHGICPVSISFNYDIFYGYNSIVISMYYFGKTTPDDALGDAILMCDKLNSKYDYGKFSITDSGLITLSEIILFNPFFDYKNFCDCCFELIETLVDRLDKEYPNFF